jgi:two-component system NtrC family sensor kinase
MAWILLFFLAEFGSIGLPRGKLHMAKMRINNKEIAVSDVFEVIVENFPDIIQSVNEAGDIIFVNKKAETVLDYSREELLSMNIRQIYADEILAKVEEGFRQLKQRGEKAAIESIIKDRSGKHIPVEIRSYSIYDDNDNFQRTFSIIRDIREIKELQDSLIHASRLAAIGEMASGIAHDMKSPLSVFSLATDMARLQLANIKTQDTDGIARVEQSLRDMNKALHMITRLSDHLTDFSRGIAERFEVVDLHTVISDSLFMSQNKIKKCDVWVKEDIAANAYFTKGAFNQLEQVFVNLIVNACDVLVGAEERTLGLSVSACTREGIQYWKCDVSDTGTGIPDDVLPDIFQSFFTTKAKGKGTGLGLSISRGIVKNHEGDIEVHSEPGKGTVFSVFLPQHPPPAGAPRFES